VIASRAVVIASEVVVITNEVVVITNEVVVITNEVAAIAIGTKLPACFQWTTSSVELALSQVDCFGLCFCLNCCGVK
jgi:hypothetical protein